MTPSPDNPTRLARRAALRGACAALALFIAAGLKADGVPADLAQKATAALADGLYIQAEKYLVPYLALCRQQRADSECRSALALLCRAFAGQRRYADILDLLDKNADIVSAGDDRPFTYWRAYALLETGNPKPALRLIGPNARTAARTNDTANLRLVRLAADAYSRLDEPDARTRAEEMLAFFLRTAPQTDPALPLSAAKLLQARLLVRGGNTDKARAIFSALADDEGAGAFTRAGALLELVTLSDTNAPAALGYADRLAALPLGKASSDYLIPCGRILVSRPETAEAGARYLKTVIVGNPTSPLAPDAQFALAEAWLSVGSNALAVAEFKYYLETYVSTPEQASRATAGRAEALYRLGDFSEAATLFQRAAATAETAENRAVYTMRAADALHAEGKYESAIPLYRTVLQSAFTYNGDPNPFGSLSRFYRDAPADAGLGFIHPRCQFQTADCLERCGEARQALEEFMRLAGESGPFAEEALYRAALLQERQGDDVGSGNAAIKSYERLISLTTNNAPLKCRALLGRGRCHYRRKSLESAILDFEDAEKGGFDSADEAALYHVYALYALGQDEKAVKRAEDFAARSPASPVLPTLALWLAQYRYNKREYAEARERFLDFAARWPDNPRTPRALLWAAQSALRLSDNQGAVDILAALGQRKDADALLPEARHTQATALCNLARFEDAVLVLDDAIAKFPSSDFATRSLILKGDAIFSLGGSVKSGYSVTNAIAAYDIASTRADATAEMRLECNFKRARCLEKAGDATAADRYYDDVIAPFYNLAEDGDVSAAGISFYERAVFACAQLKERQGRSDEAIGILRRLVQYGSPGSEPAQREIERLLSVRK